MLDKIGNFGDVFIANNFGVFVVVLIVLFFVGKKLIRDRSDKKREKRQSSLAKIESFVPGMLSDLNWAINLIKTDPVVLAEFKMFCHSITFKNENSVYDANRLAEINHDYKSIHFKKPVVGFLKSKGHRGKWICSILLHEIAHPASGSSDHDNANFKKHYATTLKRLKLEKYEI